MDESDDGGLGLQGEEEDGGDGDKDDGGSEETSGGFSIGFKLSNIFPYRGNVSWRQGWSSHFYSPFYLPRGLSVDYPLVSFGCSSFYSLDVGLPSQGEVS